MTNVRIGPALRRAFLHPSAFRGPPVRFSDAEHERAVPLGPRFKHVPGLVEEIGNIDRGERIRAFDDEHRAGLDAGERLARLEGGERAFQSPEVQVGLGHGALDIVRGPHNYAGLAK